MTFAALAWASTGEPRPPHCAPADLVLTFLAERFRQTFLVLAQELHRQLL